MYLFSFFWLLWISIGLSHSQESKLVSKKLTLPQWCESQIGSFPGAVNAQKLGELCAQVQQYSECYSQQDQIPIYHFEKQVIEPRAKKILVLAMFHGDEPPAGTLARSWMLRLMEINSRNHWRIVPIINPDGMIRSTRSNARGVDLNRNLPTTNWEQEALERWTTIEKKSERRFPGAKAASEQEVTCLLKHLNEYKPDFVISLHTPYGLLDFDGPTNSGHPKKILDLPWKGLGNYPGSLGRYMWVERAVPVLTVELKGNQQYQSQQYFNQLQDTIGTFVLKLLATPAPVAKDKLKPTSVVPRLTKSS